MTDILALLQCLHPYLTKTTLRQMSHIVPAIITMTGGRYSNSDDTSGRKCTVAQLTGVAVTTTGSATHVALNDGTSVLYVTECTGQSLTSGNTMTFNAWEIGIADPT